MINFTRTGVNPLFVISPVIKEWGPVTGIPASQNRKRTLPVSCQLQQRLRGPDRWSEWVSALGPAVRHEAPPWAVRQHGGDRQDRRSCGEPERRPAACLVAAPRAPETAPRAPQAKIRMQLCMRYMPLHVLNCKKPSTLDFPTNLRRYAVMMKMFETFPGLLVFDKLLLCYLLTSAVSVQNRFPCCPTFPDSLSYPFTYFSLSYLCNLIFHFHFSTPSSINLQFFLPFQLFFTSIPLFWLHPSYYSSSPLYPWKSDILSFLPPFHSFIFSVFRTLEISPALAVCSFLPSFFLKLQLMSSIFPLPPSFQSEFLLANCAIL